GRYRLIDHAEVEARGLAEDFDQALGILQPGDLHQDTVGALALDGGLDRAEIVDPVLADLDRLLDRLPRALDHRRLGHREADHAAAHVDDIDAARIAGAEH